jgi:hypothetical protein
MSSLGPLRKRERERKREKGRKRKRKRLLDLLGLLGLLWK